MNLKFILTFSLLLCFFKSFCPSCNIFSTRIVGSKYYNGKTTFVVYGEKRLLNGNVEYGEIHVYRKNGTASESYGSRIDCLYRRIGYRLVSVTFVDNGVDVCKADGGVVRIYL